MSMQTKEIVVVSGPGSIGSAIARRVGAGRTLLLAAHNEQSSRAAADRLKSEGFDVAIQPCDISQQAEVEALAKKADQMGPVTQVIMAGGVSPTQAGIDQIIRTDLVGTAHLLDAFARVVAPGGAGIMVASMAGHRESPYPREVEDALMTTPTARLVELPLLQADQIGTTVHAYALAKRANSLRVLTAAAAWGKRGARVNTVSPGVIITPLAADELTGPRKDWFENLRTISAAGRFATSDEVASAAAFLLGPDAGFITGADLLMDGGVTAALRTGELTI